jgi:hypothetical protein
MLVCPHNRTVEKHFLEVGLLAQRSKQRLPDALVSPTREAPKHTVTARIRVAGRAMARLFWPSRALLQQTIGYPHQFGLDPQLCLGGMVNLYPQVVT